MDEALASGSGSGSTPSPPLLSRSPSNSSPLIKEKFEDEEAAKEAENQEQENQEKRGEEESQYDNYIDSDENDETVKKKLENLKKKYSNK